MPAAKITRNDVAEAIRILNQQGIPDPGVHRLRTFLGRGSVTTVARFKSELRQIELERIAPKEAKPLPDPISRLSKRLWDELLAAVEVTEQELATITERRIADKQQQLEHIQLERDHAITKIKTLTDELSSLEGRVEDRQQYIVKLEKQIGALEGQLSATVMSVDSLRERKQHLKRTLAEISKQSAVREKSLNDQLSQERHRSFDLQRCAERRHQILETQLQTMTEKHASEGKNNERAISAAREKIHLLEVNFNSLNRELELMRTERVELSVHNERLDTLVRGLEKERVRMKTELRGKDDMIETLSARLQESKEFHAETKHHLEHSIRQLETQLSKTHTHSTE